MKKPLKERFADALTQLQASSKEEHGSQSAPLAHYGPYEVRLYRPTSAATQNEFIFWIELFDHSSQISIDSSGTNNFDEALAIAEKFLSKAAALDIKRR
jgi:hypothetical protein